MAEPPPGPETLSEALQSGVFGDDSGTNDALSAPAYGANCAAYGCGGSYDPLHSCQCNDECAEHDSCCDDFEEVCSSASDAGVTPPPLGGDPDTSCAKFGCIGFVKENPCQCNAGCQERGNCCWDFGSVCAPVGGDPPSAGAAAGDLPEGSCKEFGCLPDFDAGLPCQCNADCAQYDSCCSDFESACAMKPQLAEGGAKLAEEAPGSEEAGEEEGSCASYGCIKYDGTHPCQCNADCGKYDSCCNDYDDICSVSGQDVTQTRRPSSREESWENVSDFPVDVVDQDYKAACEAGNGLNDGWKYLYNEGRGTDNAVCGADSDYWCCRQCVEHGQRGLWCKGRGGRRRPGGAESRGGEKAADDRGDRDEDDDPDPYDCSVGAPEVWKKNKKKWCCVVREVGCEATAEPTPAPSTTTSIATTTKKTTTSTSTTEDPEADVALR